MMSPLDTVVSEFSEKYGKKAQELINALMIYIHQGWDLNKAVNQALIDVNLNDFLTDNIEQAIAKSADIGAGINRKAGIPLLKPLESSWDGSGMKLSQKLHSLKKNIHLQVTDTIKAQLALNNNVSKISRELYDGYNTDKAVIERQSLPQYITKVISFARRSDLSDYERRQLLKLCRKTRAKVDKLSEGGAPNKALKTSYNKLLDAVESSKEHAIRKAVTTAVEEKSRYVAERIARTEAARAWQDGFLQKYDGNDRVIAYKWKLSGRHPIFDICDMYAKADMYGLGKGIFPKDKVPTIPVHPHCLCHLVPVYKTELKGKHQQENIKEAGEKWLKTLPKQEQYKVLGIDGLKAWQNGADWRNHIKNYSTKTAQSRLKDFLEKERATIKDNGNPRSAYTINFKHINSKAYHDKFENLSTKKVVNEGLYNNSLKILAHRSGTEYEDIVMIDSRTGKVLEENTSASGSRKFQIGLFREQEEKIQRMGKTFEILHNHPNSSEPSYDDIQGLFRRKLAVASTVVGHDGSVYRLIKLKQHENIDGVIEIIYNEVKKEFYDKLYKIDNMVRERAIAELEEQGYLKYEKVIL